MLTRLVRKSGIEQHINTWLAAAVGSVETLISLWVPLGKISTSCISSAQHHCNGLYTQNCAAVVRSCYSVLSQDNQLKLCHLPQINLPTSFPHRHQSIPVISKDLSNWFHSFVTTFKFRFKFFIVSTTTMYAIQQRPFWQCGLHYTTLHIPAGKLVVLQIQNKTKLIYI